MKKELYDKLINTYPDMFYADIRGPQKHTISIDCNDGWFDILWRLCDDIYAMGPKVSQIKEKFGGLRFYASFTSEYSKQGWERIRKAEEESYEICELCGAKGELRITDGWRNTTCIKCHETKELPSSS